MKRCGAGRELASLASVADLSRTRNEVRSEKRKEKQLLCHLKPCIRT